ncbi:hypothetical protein [Candidatus Entotheonella palauensis]|uniref:Uncharacterized protein n=1 Tax=Candidatus Entotheonella gemina TaxID=1429439 RepID=W4L9L4_9BACT|nr:hypothetical protein [Candidatus Entotheonella palauensis]ETW94768.1 MAG: hypothetical protein ETSY2_49205 [Candidatus Entotheonella gemina]
MFKDVMISLGIALAAQVLEIVIKIIIDENVFEAGSIIPALSVGIDLTLTSITILFGAAYTRWKVIIQPHITNYMFISLVFSFTFLLICMALNTVYRFSFYPFGEMKLSVVNLVSNILGFLSVSLSVYSVKE